MTLAAMNHASLLASYYHEPRVGAGRKPYDCPTLALRIGAETRVIGYLWEDQLENSVKEKG
jgi:hypothetical protein